ncbi:MAG: hypothetical protein ABJE95_14375 [Byssovorax sp.]
MILPHSRIAPVLGVVGLLAGLSPIAAAGCGSVVGTPGGSGGGDSVTSTTTGTNVGGGVATWGACAAPGQCELAAKGCCGTCGTPQINDVNAVNRGQESAYQADNCPEPTPCPDCASMINPDLAAFCVGVMCKPIDVRTDPVSACATDADCRLRYSDCCESCATASPDLVIALSVSGASVYTSQVCAPSQACDKCLAAYPPSVKAVCAASKHCVVVPADPCPVAQPDAKTACPIEGAVCEYGADIRPSCRPRATCTGGLWAVLLVKCPPVFGPGQSGCPTMGGAMGDCSPDGLLCDLGGGDTCACGKCVGGPCSMTPHWSCATPSGGDCPVEPPLLGSACAISGLSCIYGTCGAATSAGRVCSGPVWSDAPVACPQ